MHRRLVAIALSIAVVAVPLGADAQTAPPSDPTLRIDPVSGAPTVSTREWAELEAQALRTQEQLWRESGAYEQPPAAPARSEISLDAPAAGEPTTERWSGKLTYAPDSPLFGPRPPDAPCERPECQELKLTVPRKANALYVKVAWNRPDYGIYLYAFDPSGKMHGLDYYERGSVYDKRPGNSTTLPLSEFSIGDPKPGEWRIRLRAAWGLNIGYNAAATVTTERVIKYPRKGPLGLSKWAVHRIPVNIVFAGIRPNRRQIKRLKRLLPTQYRIPVLWWEFSDAGPTDSDTHEENNCQGLTNWTKCHYGGTYSEEERKSGGNVPYFEPVKVRYKYHFIQASNRYTKAAFRKMKKFTRPGRSYHNKAQEAYLSEYNSNQGKFRGEHQVVDTTKVDMINAFKFENWIFRSRFRFCKAFKNLLTGKRHGGGFISADPKAKYDPYYNSTDNPSRMPQGRNEGETIFFFDTFSPKYAPRFFNMSRYHNFSTFGRFRDPDTGQWDGIDFGRLWGGRYRFAFFDLGAAPNQQESSGWPNGTGGGSADPPRGDPPIWEYRKNPAYRGRWIEKMGRNVKVMLFSRMTTGFLYRPILRDIYQLTTTNFNDYYSRPPYGTWWTNLKKIYDEGKAAKWLSAAIPYATFRSGYNIPGFKPYRYPGCSDVHVGSKNSSTGEAVMAPDPTCVGKTPDRLQKHIELAKAQGDDVLGAGIPFEQAVSASVIRNFWERNRGKYAPIGNGVYSFININAVFELAYTWYLPAIVGGVAFNTPHRESWGQLQNRNDRSKPASSTDCKKSKEAAPGCAPGTEFPPTQQNGTGLTYTVEHEASHSLGLLHPHDHIGVDRDAKGRWRYYYDSMVWMPDSTQSPTTYFGSIYPYGVWDQDNLMRGHVGEYLKMAQDAIAHAYFEAGRRGISSIRKAPDVLARKRLMLRYMRKGKRLFARGDYLHAEYAFKNAYLAAAGHRGREVTPRAVRPGERVFFKIPLQGGPTRRRAIRICH